MLGSPLNGLVVTRCVCCERRLSRIEDMSCAGCSQSVIMSNRVEVIAIFSLGCMSV